MYRRPTGAGDRSLASKAVVAKKKAAGRHHTTPAAISFVFTSKQQVTSKRRSSDFHRRRALAAFLLLAVAFVGVAAAGLRLEGVVAVNGIEGRAGVVGGRVGGGGLQEAQAGAQGDDGAAGGERVDGTRVALVVDRQARLRRRGRKRLLL